MIIISILLAFFLPCTFITVGFLQMLRYMEESDTSKSSFGMTNFYSREWAVSPSFWMYWAVTIPLTLIILAAWWFWCRREERFQEEFERRLKQSMLENLASKFDQYCTCKWWCGWDSLFVSSLSSRFTLYMSTLQYFIMTNNTIQFW